MMKHKLFQRMLAVLLIGASFIPVGCKDYDDDIKSINDRIDQLTTGQIATIEQQVKTINSTLTELKGVDSQLDGAIKDLQGQLKTANETLAKQQALLDKAATAADLKKVEADVAAIKGDITSLTNRIGALESAKTTMEGQIKTIESKLNTYATLSYVDATFATKEAVTELSGTLSTIKANYVDKAYLSQNYTDNTALQTKISQAIEACQNTMKTAMGEAIQEALTGYINGSEVDARISTAKSDLMAQIEALKGTSEGETVGTIKSLENRIQQLEDAKIAYDNTNADFCKGVNDLIAAAVANDGAVDKAIAGKLATLTGAYTGTIEQLAGKVDGLRVDVDALIARVQSLVYVPEVRDHKARVDFLTKDDNLVAEGSVAMTFQVQPVDAAEQIVKAYKANSEILAFYVEQVRANEAAYGLKIEKVAIADKPGRFTVTASPVAFDESFYTDNSISYSVALKLQNIAAAEGEDPASNLSTENLTSEFINLVPEAKAFEGIELMTADKDGKPVYLNGETVKYEIPYTDTETVVALMEGYTPVFKIGGEYLSVEDAKAAYGLEISAIACSHKGILPDGSEAASIDKANFKVAEESAEACDENVSLIAADKTFNKAVLKSEHSYTATSNVKDVKVTSVFNSEVKIVKKAIKLYLNDLIKFWKYSEFASVYPAAYEGDAQFSTVALKFSADNAPLPADIKKADLAQYGNFSAEVYDIDAEGNVSETESKDALTVTIDKTYDAKNDAFKVAVAGYKYGKKYQIVLSSEYANVDLEVIFDAEYVGLPAKIGFDYGETTLAYDATKDNFAGESKETVEELLKAANANVTVEGEFHFENAEELVASLDNTTNGTQAPTKVNYVSYRNDERISNETIWSMNNTDPAEYTDLRVEWGTKDKLPVYPYVLKSSVKSENDIFADTTTVQTVYGMNIELTAKVAVELPTYAVRHVPAWLYKGLGNGWLTDVNGLWNPGKDSKAVSAFTVENVDLRSGFKIVDKDGNDVAADVIEAQKLVMNFAIPETAEAHEGIEIIDDYKLSYMGKNESVPVAGTLTLDGIVLSKGFAGYEDVAVKKFDPIGNFTVKSYNISASNASSIPTTHYVWSLLSLKDNRTPSTSYELINTAATSKENMWITGNGNNGFATSVKANTVYSLSSITFELVSVSYETATPNTAKADLMPTYVNFDEENGVFTFSNLNNLKLQDNVKMTVHVTLDYPWGTKEGDITYTITK